MTKDRIARSRIYSRARQLIGDLEDIQAEANRGCEVSELHGMLADFLENAREAFGYSDDTEDSDNTEVKPR